ncbi:ImmA/IrrE family metallo-endopeptidase [uncultured Parasphingorhabdus sp.]|uniref:ImmA/IrrE family metallo-endopeptidase n=1 Tax=uncultured Parasphingorhabdus sp. TaxID=2709694 RepID=UPI002AA8B8C2|nr:ImmA/IrrE family metallo-endopeptidase [uncultured Parasphingorhabdus sp.]
MSRRESPAPEEQLAARVVERFSLEPPIDIEALASQYADVAYAKFPIEADGITIGLKRPNKKPKIRVNESISKRRKRFTLAHELGHVLIPWHTGTIVDLLGGDGGRENSKYWEMEAEANRFAASLLMPDQWVTECLAVEPEIAKAADLVARKANVSIDSAVLKALTLGPSGYLFAKSEFGCVAWSSATAGTTVNRLDEGSKIPTKPDFPFSYHGINNSYSAEYHWWKIEEKVSVPIKPEREWRDILQEIIDATCHGDSLKAKQSINGIIANANSKVRENRSIEALYAMALQRFANRSGCDSDVSRAVAHPLFKDFIVAKVYSLFE